LSESAKETGWTIVGMAREGQTSDVVVLGDGPAGSTFSTETD
jgi:hypothetical protein